MFWWTTSPVTRKSIQIEVQQTSNQITITRPHKAKPSKVKVSNYEHLIQKQEQPLTSTPQLAPSTHCNPWSCCAHVRAVIEIWCRASPIFWSVSLSKNWIFGNFVWSQTRRLNEGTKGNYKNAFIFPIGHTFANGLDILLLCWIARDWLPPYLHTEKRKNRLRICVLRWLIKKIPKCRPCSLHFTYHVWWFWCRMMTISFSRWTHGFFNWCHFCCVLGPWSIFQHESSRPPLRLKGI